MRFRDACTERQRALWSRALLHEAPILCVEFNCLIVRNKIQWCWWGGGWGGAGGVGGAVGGVGLGWVAWGGVAWGGVGWGGWGGIT
jgi:hypothetical protein